MFLGSSKSKIDTNDPITGRHRTALSLSSKSSRLGVSCSQGEQGWGGPGGDSGEDAQTVKTTWPVPFKTEASRRQEFFRFPDMCYSLPVPLCWDAATHSFKQGHLSLSNPSQSVTFLAKPKTERSLYPSTKPPSCLSLRLPAARAKDRIEGSILNQWQQSLLAQCRKGARSGRRPWQSLRLMLLPSWPILSSVTSRFSCWPSSS